VVQISIDDAYAEACKALGEAIVAQRLLTAELARLTPPEPPDEPMNAHPHENIQPCGDQP
jgi:hypothetical protein